jgi:Flp pilus assembly protein TadG
MKNVRLSFFHHPIIDQRGQVLPWVAFMMVLFVGIGAFVLDIGHAFMSYRQLQAATDAAALAGARDIYDSTAISTAETFAATTGGSNYYSTLQNVSMVPGWPKLECLTTVANMGILCEGPNAANAIQVKEQATVPTFFARIFGINQMTVSAVSTATKGKPVPLNVALLLDTTLSMDDTDSNCSNTQLGCAMTGAQDLLAGLAPSVDAVSVFTFPNIDPTTKNNDTSCSPPQSLNPSFYSTPTPGLATALPYSFPTLPSSASTGYQVPTGTGTYQITGFSNDYRSSDANQSPNSNSTLVATVGQPSKGTTPAVSGCLAPPNQAGEFGTYLAGVIYAAQAALAAEYATEMAASPTPQPINIMIVLSDGNSNASTRYGLSNQFFATNNPSASGTYPSDVGDCGQAVVAASAAKSAGTLIYAVAYGSPATGSFSWNSNNVSGSINNSGCPTDQSSFFSAFHLGSNVSAYPNISPCQTMMDIASTPTTEYFFSDYNQSASNSQCYSPNTESPTALADIFATIAGKLSKARLIPDSTT